MLRVAALSLALVVALVKADYAQDFIHELTPEQRQEYFAISFREDVTERARNVLLHQWATRNNILDKYKRMNMELAQHASIYGAIHPGAIMQGTQGLNQEQIEAMSELLTSLNVRELNAMIEGEMKVPFLLRRLIDVLRAERRLE